MKILGSVENLDNVEDALKPFYVQDEKSGKYIAQVEGHYVPASKLVEFRDTNTEVIKKLTESEKENAIFKAIGTDPKALEEEVASLRKIKQRLGDNELVEKKGFDEAVAQRTEQMKQTLEGQINSLKAQIDNLTQDRDSAIAENKRIVVSGEITRAAVAAGVLPDAIPDLLLRADNSGWTRNDKGEVVLFDRKSNSIVWGGTGAEPITPEEWVLGLKQTARHFFNIPFGGGASGSDQSAGNKNPWMKDSWDDMAQAAAYRADPVKAKQLAEAAGSRIGALPPA